MCGFFSVWVAVIFVWRGGRGEKYRESIEQRNAEMAGDESGETMRAERRREREKDEAENETFLMMNNWGRREELGKPKIAFICSEYSRKPHRLSHFHKQTPQH